MNLISHRARLVKTRFNNLLIGEEFNLASDSLTPPLVKTGDRTYAQKIDADNLPSVNTQFAGVPTITGRYVFTYPFPQPINPATEVVQPGPVTQLTNAGNVDPFFGQSGYGASIAGNTVSWTLPSLAGEIGLIRNPFGPLDHLLKHTIWISQTNDVTLAQAYDIDISGLGMYIPPSPPAAFGWIKGWYDLVGGTPGQGTDVPGSNTLVTFPASVSAFLTSRPPTPSGSGYDLSTLIDSSQAHFSGTALWLHASVAGNKLYFGGTF